VKENVRRCDRIPGDAQRCGDVVSTARGEKSQHSLRAERCLHNLLECSVAAERHDRAIASCDAFSGEPLQILGALRLGEFGSKSLASEVIGHVRPGALSPTAAGHRVDQDQCLCGR
jgi:hypothetical protein